MKKLRLVAIIGMMVSLTGCMTGTDYKYGAYAGIIAYQSYNRVVDNIATNNPVKAEIVNCVSNLWVSFDAMTNINDEVQLRDIIKESSDKLYKLIVENKFGDTNYRQQVLVKQVYKLYEAQLDKLVSIDQSKRDAAVKWLAAFREGVRLMYSIDHGTLYGIDPATKVMSKNDDGTVILISKSIEDLSALVE
jgi:hypothetical protein